MILRFDFLENATRASLLSQISSHLDDAQKLAVRQAADEAGLPTCDLAGIREVDAAIEQLDVSARVRADLHAIYCILAEAEAQVHGVSADRVHFHEVGRAAGVRNALEICLAMEVLAPDQVRATPVQAGSGTVVCAHGALPVPAPATDAIARRGIPLAAHRLPGELLTPTSAAIILHFVDAFDLDAECAPGGTSLAAADGRLDCAPAQNELL